MRVWHLLSHLSGYNEQNLYRETQYEAEVARALGVSLPITKYHLSAFAARKLLAFEPGTMCVYSDTGFNLLGQIIEKVTGLDYAQAIMNALFTPLGIKRAYLGHSLFAQRAVDEVHYHSSTPYVLPSVVTPDRPLVPYVYGGFSMELLDANAGWLTSVADYAKVLAAFDLDGNSPLLHTSTVDTMWTQMWPQRIYAGEVLRGWFRSKLDNGVTVIGHGGELNGTATLAFRRSDNVSVVAFFNKNIANPLRMFDDEIGKGLNQAADSITHWPDMNLFPAMGIPAF
jgi:CubicO group peptidase (beta-lactamase class C family)